ncbi:MAG: amino acid racemase [Candidatus Ozemobacteraceae bacterium]
MKRKKIGILGGISHESTLKYYSLIHSEYRRVYNDHYYPEVLVESLNFQKFTDYENSDASSYVEYILDGIRHLKHGGADFAAMAANSPHTVLSEVLRQSPLELISIAEPVVKFSVENRLRTLLLLGIKHTMDSDFYTSRLSQEDIRVLVPAENEKHEIDHVIFSELCNGVFLESSKRRFLEIISGYACDGVILGCTELPLFLQPTDINLCLVDTLKLHVSEILRYAMAES